MDVADVKKYLYKAQYLLRFIYKCHRRHSFEINTMGVTSGAGTAYPSGAPGFTPGI